MRTISEAIIHCSATPPNWLSRGSLEDKTEEIRRWHKARGFNDVGYHYLIDRDGTIGEGRPVSKQGAHVKGHNRSTVGVCLIGGKESKATDKFEDHYTKQQEKALMSMLAMLRAAYGNDIKISGHNEYANKGCPGFNVSDWLDEDIPDDTLPGSGCSPNDSGKRPAIACVLNKLLAALKSIFTRSK